MSAVDILAVIDRAAGGLFAAQGAMPSDLMLARAAVEKLIADRAELLEALIELDELEAECARLRAFVADLAEHGTRFDLNPCLDHTPENVASEYLRYIRRIDDSVRDLSKAALRGKEAP